MLIEMRLAGNLDTYKTSFRIKCWLMTSSPFPATVMKVLSAIAIFLLLGQVLYEINQVVEGWPVSSSICNLNPLFKNLKCWLHRIGRYYLKMPWKSYLFLWVWLTCQVTPSFFLLISYVLKSVGVSGRTAFCTEMIIDWKRSHYYDPLWKMDDMTNTGIEVQVERLLFHYTLQCRASIGKGSDWQTRDNHRCMDMVVKRYEKPIETARSDSDPKNAAKSNRSRMCVAKHPLYVRSRWTSVGDSRKGQKRRNMFQPWACPQDLKKPWVR